MVQQDSELQPTPGLLDRRLGVWAPGKEGSGHKSNYVLLSKKSEQNNMWHTNNCKNRSNLEHFGIMIGVIFQDLQKTQLNNILPMTKKSNLNT